MFTNLVLRFPLGPDQTNCMAQVDTGSPTLLVHLTLVVFAIANRILLSLLCVNVVQWWRYLLRRRRNYLVLKKLLTSCSAMCSTI